MVDTAGVHVLFLCSRNTARSQMAEAILRALAGDRYRVFSAGLVISEEIASPAIRVMAERGIDMSGQRPKSLAALGCAEFDHVITLCERMQRLRPRVHCAGATLFWPLPDPAEFSGNEEIRAAKFRVLRNTLEERIRVWLEGQEREGDSQCTSPTAATGFSIVTAI